MIKKLLKRNEFARNVLTLMTGTAIAQAIPIAISPILTRLYTPEDFGVFGLYIAIVSIVSIAAAGRYEMAIVLPKKDEDAFNILSLSVILGFITSLLMLILMLIFHDTILNIFLSKFAGVDKKEMSLLFYIIPISIFFVCLFQIFNFWSTRQKTFKVNAAARISQSGIYSATALSMGYGSFGPTGLIVGNMLGYITAFLTLIFSSLSSLKRLLPSISKERIKINAKKYKLFPIINAPHAILGGLQEHGIIFLITYYFSSFIVGFYSFTYRIMHLPVGLIGSAFYQVFYQRASVLYNNNENIQPLLKKIYIRCFIIGLPIFLVLILFAPQIFSFVFSEKWQYSGVIAQIVAPWLFLNFITSPVSSIALITNNQKKAMLIAVVDFSIRIISIIIGGITGNFETALYFMTIGCSLLLIYAIFWYYKIAGTRIEK